MIRILVAAALLAVLGSGPSLCAEDCQPTHTCRKPPCAANTGPCAPLSNRSLLARAIGAQQCCAICAASPCWCPNDYCPRPQPCIGCPGLCYCPDTYCPKPLPCVPCPPPSCCPDTYCPKPAPNLCLPLHRDALRCAPGR